MPILSDDSGPGSLTNAIALPSCHISVEARPIVVLSGTTGTHWECLTLEVSHDAARQHVRLWVSAYAR